jgi:hypothetical protein
MRLDLDCHPVVDHRTPALAGGKFEDRDRYA